MNRYNGVIGYMGDDTVDSTGLVTQNPVEIPVRGRVSIQRTTWSDGETVHSKIVNRNILDIMPPQVILDNLTRMVYITYNDEKWIISSFEKKNKRLIIKMGEVYDGTTR